MTKRQIEIFTAGCSLCDETISMVQAMLCPSCEVSIYNLQENLEKAQQYGVRAVPAIAINGTLVLTGKPDRAQLQAIGIGQPIS